MPVNRSTVVLIPCHSRAQAVARGQDNGEIDTARALIHAERVQAAPANPGAGQKPPQARPAAASSPPGKPGNRDPTAISVPPPSPGELPAYSKEQARIDFQRERERESATGGFNAESRHLTPF